MNNTSRKISGEEIRKLVAERLKIVKSGRKVSIGSIGSFNKEELISHVESGDYIGKKIIEIQLNYLKSLKKGIIFDE